MKENKYRAWSVAEKMMCYSLGSITLEEVMKGVISRDGENYTQAIYLQFTGLLDKNGKEIYEGDVVRVPDDYETYGMFANEIREVIFCLGGFRMKPIWDIHSKGNWLEDDKEFEVIGNIYENPELLKDL
jgi:uncharacterized phage protein (TIGR01671 family)